MLRAKRMRISLRFSLLASLPTAASSVTNFDARAGFARSGTCRSHTTLIALAFPLALCFFFLLARHTHTLLIRIQTRRTR